MVGSIFATELQIDNTVRSNLLDTFQSDASNVLSEFGGETVRHGLFRARIFCGVNPYARFEYYLNLFATTLHLEDVCSLVEVVNVLGSKPDNALAKLLDYGLDIQKCHASLSHLF